MRTRHSLSYAVLLGNVVFVLSPSAPSAAVEPTPIADQFQVNTYTTNYQDYPAVAVSNDGDFLVVWASDGSDGTDDSDKSIQMRRFTSSGAPVGDDLQVNSYTTGTQKHPAVAAGPNGDFVVVWQSTGSYGTDTITTSIQGQRFAADGSTQGDQFQVNSYTTAPQNWPDVAVGSGGEFVVVWSSFGSSGTDTSFYSVQGRRFDANGSPRGEDFQANSYTEGSQWWPDVSVAPSGDFVVAWHGYDSAGDDQDSSSVQGQRFAANGAFLDGQFQVNTYTTSGQSWPATAIASNGDLVVTWSSRGSSGTDSSESSIQGQRFATDGSTLGGEFQVNTYTTSFQGGHDVAFASDGQFVVVWNSNGSYGTDTDSTSIQGQRFAANGAFLDSQFQVNSYTTSSQFLADLGIGADGQFVVVWESLGSSGTDTSSYSIQGQIFAGPTLFTDGFESGDTSVWSSTVP